jgi:hypothetical protein
MATFYNYNFPSELVNDLESGLKINFEKGLVDSITVASKPSTADGFIFVFARAWNAPFKTAIRFSYTLAEFQALTFSKESIGLAYYITLDEVNNTLHNWNLLTNSQKNTYLSEATNLMAKGWLPYWRSEWNLEPGPASSIRVMRGASTLVSGVNLALSTTHGVTSTFVFDVSNIGNSILNFIGTPKVGLSAPTGITVIGMAEASLDPTESITFGLQVNYPTAGTYNTIATIASNDPLIPVFSIPITFTVD